MHRTARISAVVLALAFSAAVPSAANAGLYTVSGCEGWAPYDWAPTHITVYHLCPGFVVRNIGGNFSSPVGAEGGWIFTRRPGTNIERLTMDGTFVGFAGWQTTAWAEGGGSPGGIQVLQNCPGASCPGGAVAVGDYAVPSAAAVKVRVRCGSSSCPNTALNGLAEVRNVSVVLSDALPPSVRIVGGTLVDGNWRAGTQTVDRRRERQHGHPRASRVRRRLGSVRAASPRVLLGSAAIRARTAAARSPSARPGSATGRINSSWRPSTPAFAPTRTRRRSTSTTSRRPLRSTRRSTAGAAGAPRTSSRSAGPTQPQNAAPIVAAAYTLLPRGQQGRLASAPPGRCREHRARARPSSGRPARGTGTHASGSSTQPATTTPPARRRSPTWASTRRRPPRRSRHPTPPIRHASACWPRTRSRASPAARSRSSARARTSGDRCRPRSSPKV